LNFKSPNVALGNTGVAVWEGWGVNEMDPIKKNVTSKKKDFIFSKTVIE
jgi:hypothetical protein